MDLRTRLAVALGLVAVALVAGLLVLGTAEQLGLVLALIVLAYAFGPTVIEGVPE